MLIRRVIMNSCDIIKSVVVRVVPVAFLTLFIFHALLLDKPTIIGSVSGYISNSSNDGTVSEQRVRETSMEGPYDIMNMTRIQFNASYKNPCWFGVNNNGGFNDGHLHCLPYFYIIGVKKSGTTDLYERIKKHREFCYPSFKESQWMSRLRFGIKAACEKKPSVKAAKSKGIDHRSVQFFVSMYDLAADCIQQKPTRFGRELTFSAITGDACPATFHMHTSWETLPGNEGLAEPRFTNFHYIKHLTPDTKLIMIMRDPVSRLYSDFAYSTRRSSLSPHVFHEHVTILISTYNECFETRSVRSCVYDNALRNKLIRKGVAVAESFHAGFYAFFMKELLEVFQPNQILTILMTDYMTNMEETLHKVFRFLDMSNVNSQDLQTMLDNEVQNIARQSFVPMLPETKIILQKFFKPFNEEMAKLMKDNRYLFEHIPNR